MATPVDLVCGLCRKRTTEIVSKLCHSCNLPVHLSCAQHIAARDCGLELGFPLPTVFCSNRCYEADFLGSSASASATAAAGLDGTAADTAHGARWSPQVPNEITAALTLKIGDVSRTSRKHLSITTFRFLLSEGFDVFKAKVNSRAIKELQACTVELYIREDMSIYIRPGVHSKQAELVELSERNFETRIRKTFRNFLKRKAIQVAAASGPEAVRHEQFECDIFIYVKKESAARRNETPGRAAASRVLAATVPRRTSNSDLHGNRLLVGYMPQQQQQQQQHHQFPQLGHETDSGGGDPTSGLVGGNLSHSVMEGVIGHKRRLSETQDRDQHGGEVDSSSGYKSIRMILNGSIVPVRVNVADLLAALGLPSPAAVEGSSASGMQTDSVV